ncbi:MAG: glycerol kinase GlpK [Bacteroidales bacterium]|nr:glycerol kinase GlpK [Bacteroidales bacterium]
MKQYVLAIDQGTTSSRAIIFNKSSEIVCVAQKEFTQICPKSGWVEHNANEIWDTVCEVIKGVLDKSGLKLADIAAIGITNQRETTVLWDRKTGEPVYNALCWQSRQSQPVCEEWIAKGIEEKIHAKTGLIINPYFSASKIRWIMDNVPGVKERAENGELCFGTIDSFLVYKLTEGKLHITDVTNASRTMMFNITEMKWDEELLGLYGIPACLLPKVMSNSEVYGNATALKAIDASAEVPVASMIGDQQASLFGQCCFEMGSVKNTYGTGCFMLMNTKDKPVFSKNGLLTTIAWKVGGQTEYALEGSVFIGGSAVQWLRDGLRFFEKSSDCEKFTTTSDGVYVVPAFVGLGTPYWDNDARGAVFGLTRATSRENFVTATIESIAYQSKDVMEVMKEESGMKIGSLAVDGGASANNYMMQFQADILDVNVIRPVCLENTALGAAYLAGLATGVWNSKDDIIKNHSIDRTFTSAIDEEKRAAMYKGWKKAVEATRVFK